VPRPRADGSERKAMRPELIRRLIYLATFVLFVMAVLVLPGMIAPKQVQKLHDRLPPRVAKRLKRLPLGHHGPRKVDPELVERPFKDQANEDGRRGVEFSDFAPIMQLVTGESMVVAAGRKSRRPSGPLASQVKVIATLAPPDAAMHGGFAVLQVNAPSGVSHQISVKEGDILENDAVVKRILKDTVVFSYRDEEHELYREGISSDEIRELERIRRRASDSGLSVEKSEVVAAADEANVEDEDVSANSKGTSSSEKMSLARAIAKLLEGVQTRPHVENLGIAGYAVESVEPESPASLCGLRPGDVLLTLSVGGTEIGVKDELSSRDIELSYPVKLRFRRGAEEQSIVLASAE